jgi:hypothetical protein
MNINLNDKSNPLRAEKVSGYGDVIAKKVEIISEIKHAESIRDFGGLYIVHGKFLLRGAVSIGAKFAQMIDVTYIKEFENEILKATSESKNLKVDYFEGDFRKKEIFSKLDPVDVSLLYEVLLHQENAVEVMKNVSDKTNKYIIIAQPCLKESLFNLPNCCTNIQFIDENLKDELRKESFWPKEERVNRFTTKYWMWGQTTSYLISVMNGLGWELESGYNCENVCGYYWDYPIMRFKKVN